MAWRGAAEFVANYGAKGRLMAAGGHLQSRKYTDKAGNTCTAWEVQAENVYFLDSAKKEQDNGQDFKEIDDDGELPF